MSLAFYIEYNWLCIEEISNMEVFVIISNWGSITCHSTTPPEYKIFAVPKSWILV